jgi:putative cardiolipin synthase
MDTVSSLLRRSHWVFALAVLLSAGCTTRPPVSDYQRTPSYTITSAQDTALGKTLAHAIKAHPDQSGFQLIPNGSDAFMMRIALVESAQRSIDLQYFSTEEDSTGKLLLETLLRAADRGVRVRMLLDDWNIDAFKAGVAALNTHPNIEIRAFNPYSTGDQSIFAYIGNVFTRPDQLTRRMHNKALIADDEISIMGGRNLGDEYFGASADSNFRDMDVLSVGPITDKISKSFDRYWNSAESYPVEALGLPESDAAEIARLREDLRQHWDDVLQSAEGKRLRETSLTKQLQNGQVPLVWAKAELAADNPGKIEQPSATSESKPEIKLDQLVNTARHEFIVISPYFVPLDSGVDWLVSLVNRGVAVRIATNSLASTDMVPAEAGYSQYRTALVAGGVQLYELKPKREDPVRHMFKGSSQNGIHAKLYVIDRRDLVIGSFNLDPRSIHLNTEQVLVIHNPALAEQAAKMFETIIAPESSYHLIIEDGSLVWVTQKDGQEVRYSSDPKASFRRSVTFWLFSMLPIDNEL